MPETQIALTSPNVSQELGRPAAELLHSVVPNVGGLALSTELANGSSQLAAAETNLGNLDATTAITVPTAETPTPFASSPVAEATQTAAGPEPATAELPIPTEKATVAEEVPEFDESSEAQAGVNYT